jgi:hypothetical protein
MVDHAADILQAEGGTKLPERRREIVDDRIALRRAAIAGWKINNKLAYRVCADQAMGKALAAQLADR